MTQAQGFRLLTFFLVFLELENPMTQAQGFSSHIFLVFLELENPMTQAERFSSHIFLVFLIPEIY
jgi:hypothetical protein